MKKVIVSLVCGSFAFGLLMNSALAIPQFSAEFVEMYHVKAAKTPEEKALAEAVNKVKCNVCHEGTNKKNRNEYGKALDQLLDKKADAKDKDKIKEALKKVAEMKAKDGSTFGEHIAAGKLPVDPE